MNIMIHFPVKVQQFIVHKRIFGVVQSQSTYYDFQLLKIKIQKGYYANDPDYRYVFIDSHNKQYKIQQVMRQFGITPT